MSSTLSEATLAKARSARQLLIRSTVCLAVAVVVVVLSWSYVPSVAAPFLELMSPLTTQAEREMAEHCMVNNQYASILSRPNTICTLYARQLYQCGAVCALSSFLPLNRQARLHSNTQAGQETSLSFLRRHHYQAPVMCQQLFDTEGARVLESNNLQGYPSAVRACLLPRAITICFSVLPPAFPTLASFFSSRVYLTPAFLLMSSAREAFPCFRPGPQPYLYLMISLWGDAWPSRPCSSRPCTIPPARCYLLHGPPLSLIT
jgi:hypothetical protein